MFDECAEEGVWPRTGEHEWEQQAEQGEMKLEAIGNRLTIWE